MRWILTHPERPWTLNAERSMHYHKRAKLVAVWRSAFKVLAEEADIPAQVAIAIEATPYLTPRGRIQDCAAAFPAVKAGIDGLVDAGVIPDDSPTYLKSIKFNSPIRAEQSSLVLTVFPA